MKLKKIKFGLYQKKNIIEGTSFGVTQYDRFGCDLLVETKQSDTITIHVYIKNPKSKTFNDYKFEISTNRTQTVSSSVLPNKLDGAYILKITFPDYPELETIEQPFSLYRKRRGMLFSEIRNFPVAAQDIQHIQEAYNITFCEDYLQFIRHANGVDLGWEHDYMSYYKNEINTVFNNFDSKTIFTATHLFGVGHFNRSLDFVTQAKPYPIEFLQWAYPVGCNLAGENLFQISQGKYKGKLAELNDKAFWNSTEKGYQLYNVATKKPFTDYKNTAVDQFFENTFTIHTTTFKDYLNALLNLHITVRKQFIKKRSESNRQYNSFEHYQGNFLGITVPELLVSLFQFQQENLETAMGYSESFYLSHVNDTFYIDLFQQTYIPFAKANGSGSVYGFWRYKPDQPLDQQPIVMFGDEGGLLVVAKNLKGLLENLVYDSEPYLYGNEDGTSHIEFGKPTEECLGYQKFLLWLKHLEIPINHLSAKALSEKIMAIHSEFESDFSVWKATYYDAFYNEDEETEKKQCPKAYINCFLKGVENSYAPFVLEKFKAVENLSEQAVFCEDPDSSKTIIRISDLSKNEKDDYFSLFHRGRGLNTLETSSEYKSDLIASGEKLKGLFKTIYYLPILHLEDNLSAIVAQRKGQEIILAVSNRQVLFIDWEDPSPITSYTKLLYKDGSEKQPAIPYTPYPADYIIQSLNKFWQNMDEPNYQWAYEVESYFAWKNTDDGSWRFKLCIELLRAATRQEEKAIVHIGVGAFEDMESVELYQAIRKIDKPPAANLILALRSVRTDFMQKEILDEYQKTLKWLEQMI